MNRDLILAKLTEHLQRQFGHALELRALQKVRRVTGDAWTAGAVLRTTSEEIVVGELELSLDGELAKAVTNDDLVAAIRKSRPEGEASATSIDEGWSASDGLDDLFGAPSSHEPILPSLEGSTPTAVYEAAIAHGDRAHLARARDALPRFLADPETRGTTLFLMSDIERRMGEVQLALGYLEAALRDFANRFDVEAMDRCEAAARDLCSLTGAQFEDTPIGKLVQRQRQRLRPLAEVTDSPVLRGLPQEEREWLARNATTKTLDKGEILLREGDPSEALFVIRSGVLGVLIDGGQGDNRLIRCLYPGLVFGESSVLSENPRCTASIRAEQPAEVWRIDAPVVELVTSRAGAFRDRLLGTRYLHQIDSFLSLHETLGNLDPATRDNLLSCVHTVQVLDEDAIAISRGEVPELACLVARGKLALYAEAEPDPQASPLAEVEADQFFGVRDALHGIASERTAVARKGSIVVFFDAERLRKVASEGADELSLTLERLG